MMKILVFLMAGVFYWLDLSTGLPGELQAQTVNTVGKIMPADAAPLSNQVYRHMYPEPRTLDVSANIYEASGSLTLFDPLLKQNTNHELIPAAAEMWEVSEDGRIWTFHLRDGGRWSDGRPVTAYDFEYTIRRLLDPITANPYAFFYYDIAGASGYNRGVAAAADLGVRALDALTLEITTEEPRAYFPYIMAFHGASPAPQWAISKHGPKWTDPGNFVSNGSYALQAWRAGDRITMALDPLYNGPNKGYVEEIRWIFSPTMGSVGILPYENGEVDRVAPVDVVDMVHVSQDPELSEQLVQVADGTTWYLFFKTDRAPFDDVRVRRAIAHAIDRETITRVVLRGAGVPAYTMLPPGFPGYLAEKYRSYQQYSPESARLLLASAGY
ncbi:MAG: peptide ABC transporter substrate-binding protein, partial [Candidatus Latescibacteria bacterium]|nr:peptide ABC transporter substrate-binding protein [Candidatus Latescibacterota bacterium]